MAPNDAVLNDVLQGQTGQPQPSPATPDPNSAEAPQTSGIPAPVLSGTPYDTTMGQAFANAGITPPATSSAPKSPFLTALTQGADAAAAAQPKSPTGAPVPGAWARSIVAGTQQALSGVTSALGDAAAVGELPKHTNALGGVLTGIARTENARNQRMTDEQNQKLATVKANIDMHHQQMLIQQLDEAMQEKHIAHDQQAMAVLQSSPVPMETVGHDVSSKDIDAMLRAPAGRPNKINMGEYTAFQSGIGENGMPLFDVVKLPDRVSLDVRSYDLSNPDAAAKADQIRKTADLIQQWTGKDFHGSEMSGAEFNKYYTIAKGAQATDDARKQALAEANIKAADITDKEAWTHISGPWANALSGHEKDPVDALNTLEKQHPELIQQYPNLPELVRKNYGEQYWEDRIKANQTATTKAVNTVETQLDKFSNPSEWKGSSAQTSIDLLDALKKTPDITPAQIARIENMQATGATIVKHNAEFAANEEKLKIAAQLGDPKAAGKLLYEGIGAPSQLQARSKPEFAVEAFTEAARLAALEGKTWDAPTAEAQFKVAENPQQATFFRSANSLLDQKGTLDQMAAQFAKVPQGKFPALNSAKDWESLAAGGDPLAGFAATALGVADDYSKVMGGGAGSDTSRSQALALLKPNQSADQMRASLQSIRDAVTSQRDASFRNPYLKKMYGDQGVVAPKAQPTAKPHAPDLQRPARFPTATGTKQASDGKMYWFDIQGKPLGQLTPEEAALATKE